MTDEPAIKVVGWGPFPLPGEKKRLKRATQQARRMLDLVDEAEQRSEDTEPDKP